MIKVLLATNDSVLERMIQVTLTVNGLSVKSVFHLISALTELEKNNYQIILLDHYFSDVAVILRAKGVTLPILAMTSPPVTSSTKDVEYLSQPFHFPALKAKMNGMLKRSHPLKEKVIIQGNIKIDLINQFVTVKDEVLNLGKMEFALLVSLARRAGKIVSKEKMRNDLEAQGQFFNTAIYHHIKELRRKLKEATHEKLNIRFVTGEGFELHSKL